MLESLSQDLQHRPVRLVDVLRAKFPKTKSVPFDRLCECLPSLQPRYYSIASDPMSHVDGSLEIFVRLIKGGVASQHLASHPHHVYGFIRKSSFHLPKGRNKPILMIGPGTGIAPLLGFLHRRSAQMRKQQRSGSVQDNGPVWLFHGCRLREHYTHRIEGLVEAHVDSNALQHLFVCFSREETPRGTADRRY
ncbi:cytochrome P450, putative, partial [Bodo saltans]